MTGKLRSLHHLIDKWSRKGIHSQLSERNNVITLHKLVVPKDIRRQGIGTEIMKELLEYADTTRQRIALSPSTDFGGTKSRLLNFYKRFGFVKN